ncbi:MAG: phosphoribosyltransferase [Bacteroidales bacterium]|jgi:hypoxanthine phosphoribosyltransferase|nr:phosphoribosyltransferase [Bacteroidales bacterium]OQC02970.1 MAG: xanthine-guanine phosphoribosyltransferase [Bacteroidetes bacterium ADurb.Bin090]NLV38217.1 phosphoribosyltransferase [Bacteroidales bacterium]HNZ81547.1 phosphoribosyltransferase [Bacteroidales bacterium]HOD27373.1 phosphoribosyltransferase [Bacteroidales bacterium]
MEQKGFTEVLDKFRQQIIDEEFDQIVAIANGGIIPAAILAQKLELEVFLLKINLRDKQQRPLYDQPKLLAEIDFDCKDKRILLVEDRVKTGSTLNFAKQLLNEAGAAKVKSFAVNGKADYSLYDENCFRFPWII